MAALDQGLAPVVAVDCQLLILGSMPGRASLAAQNYYAHPRNLFWPFMSEMLQTALPEDFAERYQLLKQRGIGLWDVIAECERPGSLDQKIVSHTIKANDLTGLVAQLPKLQAIALNGKTAAQQFRRHYPHLINGALTIIELPSTSPANASVPYAQKCTAWRGLCAYTAGN